MVDTSSFYPPKLYQKYSKILELCSHYSTLPKQKGKLTQPKGKLQDFSVVLELSQLTEWWQEFRKRTNRSSGWRMKCLWMKFNFVTSYQNILFWPIKFLYYLLGKTFKRKLNLIELIYNSRCLLLLIHHLYESSKGSGITLRDIS